MIRIAKKSYNVWQLTDGTVVIQGDESIEKYAESGRFRWVDTSTHAASKHSAVVHWIYALLDNI